MNPVVLVVSCAALAMALAADFPASVITPLPQRSSEQDLAISNELSGAIDGKASYIPRSQIEKIHPVTTTVTGDPNFTRPTKVEGVELGDLLEALHIPEQNTLVAAVCNDQYEAHFTAEYRAAHHPILVYGMNGKALASTSRDADSGVYGPYLISHTVFRSRYVTDGRPEESQIPNGLIELRFLKEDKMLAAIKPHGDFPEGSPIEQGYRMAQEDCLRCHNQGEYGGHKANRTWQRLARLATTDPDFFAAYIRDPQSQYALAQMPGEPSDSDQAIQALTAYFQNFAQNGDAP